jgi:hypothetical protein
MTALLPMSPLRGLRSSKHGVPWADAHGYKRLPLRGHMILAIFISFAVPLSAIGQDAIVETLITAADREHWAFAPLVRPEVPTVEDKGKWARTAVDRFVLTRLKEKAIAPHARASFSTNFVTC